MTKAEQELMHEAPTTAVCPRCVKSCGAVTHTQDGNWNCTLMAGHVGPHIAHGIHNIPARVWRQS